MRSTTNPAFWRALHSLAHPVSIAAVALLLLNDHWLRWHYPSWLTGKLGDFTWLVFAPFIAAAALAWVLPRRNDVAHHERLVGLTAFAFIGLWFGLAKTVPAVHGVTVQAWEAVIGWRGTLRMDASDLLTLPALLLGWWVWTRSANRPLNLRPLAWAALGLGVVATLASDCANYIIVDAGITTICEDGDRLIITSSELPSTFPFMATAVAKNPASSVTPEPTLSNAIYYSRDGGLTWYSDWMVQSELPKENCSESDIAIDPNNTQIQYRWQAGERIESSVDGGTTWRLDRELVEMQQDVREFYNHYDAGSECDGFVGKFYVGPVTGIVDIRTGNLVLAMSWDGVLVRTPEGIWQWVSVDSQYQLADVNNLSQFTFILFFEIWLAGAFSFLIITTSTTYMRQYARRRGIIILLIAGWISWLILSLMLPGTKGHTDFLLDTPVFNFALASLLLLVFLALPLSIGAVWDIARNFRSVWRKIAVASVGVGLLFLLPFIPWTQGTIPRYTTALAFALLLAASGVVAAGMYLRRVLPILPKPDPQPPAADMKPDQSS